MTTDSVLSILAQGAWNGGTLVDNSHYENIGLSFKNNIPVNRVTIEERIGVRTRMAAPEDERIGVTALTDLLENTEINPSKIKWLIGATNVGEDKYDPGPLIRFPLEVIRANAPDVVAVDLYAGCPGFNVATEMLFMLSLDGILTKDDLSIIVGAENIHRAKAFRATGTASIIFGDDALATAFVSHGGLNRTGQYTATETITRSLDNDPVDAIAQGILEITGDGRIDGLIVDNQLGKIYYRVPAIAARIQQRLTELRFPDEAAKGVFHHFKKAHSFYNKKVNSFAFDIMSMTGDTKLIDTIGRAYVRSGKYNNVTTVRAGPDGRFQLTLHRGAGFTFQSPQRGIVDTATSTHGCFGAYIQAIIDQSDGDVYGEMNGKGVFLYATRGAGTHLDKLLKPHRLTINDIDLLIEHQANFAMIPLTLEQLLKTAPGDVKKEAVEFIANKTLINVHTRGNCSVVCMQRLPYDLSRGALEADTVQGVPINRNLDRLQGAKTILYDSVGAGMTRSSFLLRK